LLIGSLLCGEAAPEAVECFQPAVLELIAGQNTTLCVPKLTGTYQRPGPARNNCVSGRDSPARFRSRNATTFRSILEGLATAKEILPESLALLATHKRVRAKQDLLRKALRGCHLTEHFRFLLGELLEELDTLTNKMTMLEQRIAERMQPHAELVERLREIPGVDRLTAWTIIAEVGTDMGRFPKPGNMASWCGLCPGNRKTANKRHSGRIGKGNQYIRRAMVQAAWAASRITRRRTFFTTFFHRISTRAGMKKAAVAVAHRILVIAYCMISDGSRYREQGPDYFDRLHPGRTKQRLVKVKRLDRLGFAVQLTPKTPLANQLSC